MHEIAKKVASLRRDGARCALATIVLVSGSTYRRPGARMLITSSGEVVGCVSGGCLEREVVRLARKVMQSGVPRVETFDSTFDEDAPDGDYGLGCNGVVQILVEALTPDAGKENVIEFVARNAVERRDAWVATIYTVEGAARAQIGQRWMASDGDALIVALEKCGWGVGTRDAISRLPRGQTASVRVSQTSGAVHILLERIAPPRAMTIFGAGHDAVPLVGFAKALGWHVTLVENRPDNLARARGAGGDRVVAAGPVESAKTLFLDERAAVVLMNHNFQRDLAALRVVTGSCVGYIGILGPRRRTQRLLETLGETAADDRERLYGPVGLDLGADNPEEIAMAIMAEIQAVCSGRNAGFVRDRRGPLHAIGEETVAIGKSQPVRSAACSL